MSASDGLTFLSSFAFSLVVILRKIASLWNIAVGPSNARGG